MTFSSGTRTSTPDLGAAACDVFGEVARREGMTVENCSTSALTFRDVHRVVEFGYYPEDLPAPVLSVVLGWAEPATDVMRLALWRIHPEVPEFADGTTLRFDSEAALRERLVMVRDRWWQPYVLSAFTDRSRLRAAWLAERREADDRYRAESRKQDLSQARAAADRGSHREALDLYALLSPECLTAADKRRILLARRALE